MRLLAKLILSILAFGGSVHAAEFEYTCLNGTVKELAEVRVIPNPEAQPRCFRLGRMQTFNDLLTYRENRIGAKATDNPAHQARCVFEAQQMHLSVYTFLTPHIDMCDNDFLKVRYARQTEIQAGKPAPNLVQLMSIVNKDMKKALLVEPVAYCFHLGRMAYLVRKFEDNLVQMTARGQSVSAKHQARAAAARRKVLAGLESCGTAPNHAF